MIRFRALGTEFRLHVLTLAAGALAMMLGLNREMPFILLAVGIHELAHIAAAKICGMEIEYIDIMCFGGRAQIQDIYSENRMKLAVVAVAGPAANFLLAVCAAALAWWDIISFYNASVIVRLDLLLMFFNLMPALPLDGGRILYALLSMWVNESLALRIGVVMAHILALALVGICIYGWVTQSMFNLTLILMAVFLTAGSTKELESAREGAAGRTLAALCGEYVLPGKAQLVAFPTEASPGSAASYFSKDKITVFAMVDGGIVREMITGEEMARRVIGTEQ